MVAASTEGTSTQEASASQEWDFFLCYAGADVQAAAALQGALEARGLRVFFARESNHGGEWWQREIRVAITRSRQLIALVSRHSANADFQKIELLYARDCVRQRVGLLRRVVPVLASDAGTLGDVLFDLALNDLHCLSWPGFEAGSRAFQDLPSLLCRPESLPFLPRVERRSLARRLMLPGGLLLIAVAAMTLGWLGRDWGVDEKLDAVALEGGTSALAEKVIVQGEKDPSLQDTSQEGEEKKEEKKEADKTPEQASAASTRTLSPPARYGFTQLGCKGVAMVKMDGRKLGSTRRELYSISSGGSHTFQIWCDTQKGESWRVTPRAGEQRVFCWDFTSSAACAVAELGP